MEANKVLLIFETLAPSAFIIEMRVGRGGAGQGGVRRPPDLGRQPTWLGRGLGRPGRPVIT